MPTGRWDGTQEKDTAGVRRHGDRLSSELERHSSLKDARDTVGADPPPTISQDTTQTASNEEKLTPGSKKPPALRRSHSRPGGELERRASIDDARSLVSADRPPSEDENLPPSKVYHPFSPHVIALLMPASIFGALARVGLLALTTYDGREIFPLAWVQAAGCLVMGFAVGMKEPIGEFYGPLYTAITTGFCGSLTTFSSWQLDVFSSWLNTANSHRDWFRDVIDGLGKTIFTIAISLSAVTFGSHLAAVFGRYIPRLPPPPAWLRYTFTAASVLTYAAAYPAYFRMSPTFRHQATAAILFSFPGTLCRYILSIKVNPLLKLFPLGTFTANAAGTALIGTFHVLQSTRSPPSPNACGVLQGLIDGYCGCLTTVSTFATEVKALTAGKAWFYVVLSWVTCQCLLLIILGSSYWAGDVRETVTCVYTT